MDGQKFDKMTRAFAAGTDRRTLLKIFGGATVAGVAGIAVARTEGVLAQNPGEGDPCSMGTQSPCGDTTLVCCATSDSYGTPGGQGVCTSGMTGCQVGEGCISGTEDPCGFFNYTYDVDYICCTYGGDPGSEGTCVAQDDCVLTPPNTGAGTASDSNKWIAPIAAAGAAAALLAYKNREQKSDTEA